MKIIIADSYLKSLNSWKYKLGELIYKFKCWAWKRYTTVKPRHLGHTWADKREMLVHMSFELLLQFYEEEFDEVNWYGEYAPMLHGEFVGDIIKELVNWFNNDYLPFWRYENQEIIRSTAPDPLSLFIVNENNMTEFSPQYASKEDELMNRAVTFAIAEYEAEIEKETERMLKKLAEIRLWLWT